jgi:hypothetical protein
MIVLSMAALFKTDGFRVRNWSLVCGITLGLGMLTKSSFAFFVAVPLALVAWQALRQPSSHARVNAVIALALVGIALPWYLYNLEAVRSYLTISSTLYPALEGDPTEVPASIFLYLRDLVNTQMTLGGFLLLTYGLITLVLRRPQRSWGLIFLWIAVSFLILVLNPNKDGRYIAPILPAAALVSAAALTTIPSHLLRRILIGVTIVWGSFLFVVSTFTQDLFPALRWLPSRAYVTIAGQGWIIYSSRYGHASPPRKEDWRQQAILEDVTIDAATHPGRTGQQISLLALPDAQYFHANTFQYYVTLQSRPIEVYRLAEILPLDPDYLRAATQSDYIVDKTDDKGPEWTLRQYVLPVSQGLHDPTDPLFAAYQLIRTYSLPDGSMAELFRRRSGKQRLIIDWVEVKPSSTFPKASELSGRLRWRSEVWEFPCLHGRCGSFSCWGCGSRAT